MLPRLAAAPFAPVPKAVWKDSLEKKPRIPVEDLIYSSSDDDDDESQGSGTLFGSSTISQFYKDNQSVSTFDQEFFHRPRSTHRSEKHTAQVHKRTGSSYAESSLSSRTEHSGSILPSITSPNSNNNISNKINNDVDSITDIEKSLKHDKAQDQPNKQPINQDNVSDPEPSLPDDEMQPVEEEKKKHKRRNHGKQIVDAISKFIIHQLRKSESYQDFQHWRRRQARLRRHHLLKYYEDKVLRVDEERNEAIERELEEHQHALLEQIDRREKLKKKHEKKVHLQRIKEVHKENEMIDRRYEAAKMSFFVHNMPQWSDEGEMRRQRAEEERVEEFEMERRRQAVIAEEKKKKALRLEESKLLKADWVESQEVMKLMRKHGTIDGVNVPSVPPKIPQHEMSTSVDLTLRDGIDLTKPHKLSKKEKENMFNVDLIAFRNVTELRGHLMGEKGVLVMAADFVRGACPRLEELNLTGCMIRARGLGRLLHGIRMGNMCCIRKIILKGNAITARGVDYIVNTLEKGGLQDLEVLDLSENEIGDNGLHTIAHSFIKQLFKTLKDFKLQRNNIGDSSFRSLVDILISLHDDVCPVLHSIHLQENLISAAAKRSFHPLPSFILV